MLNPPPITSLVQLVANANAEGSGAPTMERTLAAIMARFERMWDEFVRERGSFASFMDLYLERWLHSCVSLMSPAPGRILYVPSQSLVVLTSTYNIRQGPARDSHYGHASAQGADRGHHARPWAAPYPARARCVV